jgi:hypothetical protein
MSDAERLARAMAGEYVGTVGTLAPVLVAEIARLRALAGRDQFPPVPYCRTCGCHHYAGNCPGGCMREHG